MNQISLSTAELKTIFKIEIQFLKNSCESFDNDFKDEAMRIATVIRVLLHDTSSSVSLLEQLNLKSIKFYDSAEDFDPKSLMSHHGLVGLTLGGGTNASFYAGLGKKEYKMVLFDEWWNKNVIGDKPENQFTRKDLVLILANKEGGAHVDPSLKEEWYELTRLNSSGWEYTSEDGSSQPVEGVEKYSMRQIAFEVL